MSTIWAIKVLILWVFQGFGIIGAHFELCIFIWRKTNKWLCMVKIPFKLLRPQCWRSKHEVLSQLLPVVMENRHEWWKAGQICVSALEVVVWWEWHSNAMLQSAKWERKKAVIHLNLLIHTITFWHADKTCPGKFIFVVFCHEKDIFPDNENNKEAT